MISNENVHIFSHLLKWAYNSELLYSFVTHIPYFWRAQLLDFVKLV